MQEKKKIKLTAAERKQIAAAIERAKGNKKEISAQQTVPYIQMYPDGICKITKNQYSKTIQFLDINYQLAQNDDKAAIFENWCDFLNYFDSSIKIQLSFINQKTNKEDYVKAIEIPLQPDNFNHIRQEYSEMLKNQLAKGNNGLVKTKYITFTIEADDLRAAKLRLERIEIDILNHFKILGVQAFSLTGKERLQVMFNSFHPDGSERFNFEWEWLPKLGASTKDFIVPTSFAFNNGMLFRMGNKYGAAHFLDILAPELNDRMLADFLDMENCIIANIHIRSVDQTEAIKTIKRKITDLDRMKIEEQKKAVRSGYDMDIIPSDLATYGNEAKNILNDLQSRNERMFLVTVIIISFGNGKKDLDNNILQAKGIAQKYNCTLCSLDYQQEQGLMSSVPIGINQIEIQRSLTTSSTAIFVPFTTQELFQTGEALYYGLNALSNNMIMADRKRLKNPNGLILGTPGCLAGETRIQLAGGNTIALSELVDNKTTEIMVRAYDDENKRYVNTKAVDIRISKKTTELRKLYLSDNSVITCTDTHLILDNEGIYHHARDICAGKKLSGGHEVMQTGNAILDMAIPVYDMDVPKYNNFVLENGVIVHNSGKSFSAKREIANSFIMTEDDVIICDPEGEYYALVKEFGGQVIRISPTSTQYVNPMDINLNYSEEDSPLALKSDFILSLCELIVGGKDGLTPTERSIIDRCVKKVYEEYLLDPKPEKMPILEDLYNALLTIKNDEAERLAMALEIYVSGSLNVFNNRTNVDIENRIVCFDIKELGKQLKKLGMLIIQDQVWNRVTVNRNAKKSTRYYVDEFHLLLKEAQTATYSVEIWKRFRKWGGIPTGITQNVKDLLASREIENIFENSDFIYMLNQAAGDRMILAKQLSISPTQLSYVTHSDAGEGLLFFGNVILPFRDPFPKDTMLYRIMSTRLNENI